MPTGESSPLEAATDWQRAFLNFTKKKKVKENSPLTKISPFKRHRWNIPITLESAWICARCQTRQNTMLRWSDCSGLPCLLVKWCLQAEVTVEEWNRRCIENTANQPIWTWQGPRASSKRVQVLYFLDQGDIWGVLAEGLVLSGASGAQEADIQELVWTHFSIFTTATISYLPKISSTNEKLLLQRDALMPWIKEAWSFLNSHRGANVLQVFFQAP